MKRTRVLMGGRWGRVVFSVEGDRFPSRLRRQIVLALFRGIAEEVRSLGTWFIHDDLQYIPRADEESREISFRNAPVLDTPEGRDGSRIRFRRMLYGLSQEQLAIRAGLSANQISRIERGQARPTALTLAKIERALIENS